MDGQLFQIGQPFPDDRYRGARDGAVVSFRETTFDIIIFLDMPTKLELQAFSSAPFSYGLFKEDYLPFMILDFKVMNFAPTFNVLQFPEDLLNKWINSDNNAMVLFLVDANSYRLERMRMVGLDGEFMKDLRNTLAQQKNTFRDMAAIDLKRRQLERKHSVKEMLDSSKRFRIG